VRIVASRMTKRALPHRRVPTSRRPAAGEYSRAVIIASGPRICHPTIVGGAPETAELVQLVLRQFAGTSTSYVTRARAMEFVASTRPRADAHFTTQSERLGSIIRKVGIKLD